MVRTRGRDGSMVRRGQLRRGVSTWMHGQLAIDLEASFILVFIQHPMLVVHIFHPIP